MSVGVQIITAPIAGSARIASMVATFAPVAAASAFAAAGVGVGDRGELRARVRGDVAAVDAADPPGPE